MEAGGYRLADARGMRDLVPFVRTNEGNKIKEELSEKSVSATLMEPPGLMRHLLSYYVLYQKAKLCRD